VSRIILYFRRCQCPFLSVSCPFISYNFNLRHSDSQKSNRLANLPSRSLTWSTNIDYGLTGCKIRTVLIREKDNRRRLHGGERQSLKEKWDGAKTTLLPQLRVDRGTEGGKRLKVRLLSGEV
jgi:hypothetical protein